MCVCVCVCVCVCENAREYRIKEEGNKEEDRQEGADVTKITSSFLSVFFASFFSYYCEQVLFVRFTIIPPRLTDQCNFITVL